MLTEMNPIKVNVRSNADTFWNAVKIYCNHSNSINQQVLFSEKILSLKSDLPLDQNECQKLYNEICNNLIENQNLLHNVNQKYFKRKGADDCCDDDEDDVNSVHGMSILIRKLIPKQNVFNADLYEFLFLDKEQTKFYIYTKYIKKVEYKEDFHSKVVAEQDPYVILKFTQIECIYNGNYLEFFYDNNLREKGINWLKAVFITKFVKLMSNVNNKSNHNKSNKLFFTSKVDVVQYYKLYNEMKSKYAKFFIENWTESSDPEKYVFEDIGIATYLMLLWNGGTIPPKNAKKYKFVDLGCGNGLLVHILNSEGHLGVGLDMRKRKIWDIYPSTTVLKVETINPISNGIYSEFDWLIGNHSDELTAWIPIMARRSGSQCQYFVLPCCPFQLNGKKYQRKNSGLSSYQDFLNYVKDISLQCDFETFLDKLRIPSTKRVCIIGLNKHDISEEKIDSINEHLMDFIKQECQSLTICSQDNYSQAGKTNLPYGTNLDFKVRESVEKVRNCTKLPEGVISEILNEVMNVLLKEHCTCTVVKDGLICNWNRGRKMSIRELAKSIEEELLKQLKEECKGLQTLLKNHHFLFEVSEGYVQFRSPESMINISYKFLNNGNKSKWKIKSCWFYDNHPDKCPLPDNVCSYIHNS